MVEDGLDAGEEVGRVDVVLSRHLAEQQARIVQPGVADGTGELGEQEGDDAVTGQLDVDNLRSAVYLFAAEAARAGLCVLFESRHVVEQMPFEGAGEDGVLVLDEHLCAGLDKAADDA